MTLFWPDGAGDSLEIRGARVVDPTLGIDGPHDVTVEDGVITAVEPAAGAAAGLVLAPAFVDPHVHLRVPGREDEETIATGTAAAAAGGYCAVLAMPNTDPVVADSVDALIETQVRAGLVVRMAVLYDLLTHGPVEVKAEIAEEVA